MAELSTLARPYAKAAFQLASEHKGLDQWSQMLSVLAAVSLDEKVQSILASPDLTFAEKASVLNQIAGEALNETANRLVEQLSENNRLSLLPEIASQYEELKAELEKSVEVQVTSAFPLSDAQTNTLIEKLKAKLGQDVSIATEIDTSIIGGVVIRANDLVIDGSVRGKLAKLAEAMNS